MVAAVVLVEAALAAVVAEILFIVIMRVMADSEAQVVIAIVITVTPQLVMAVLGLAVATPFMTALLAAMGMARPD